MRPSLAPLPDMVHVAAGRFPMGIEDEEVASLCRDYAGYGPTRYDAERPRRDVDLDEFEIMVFPVTNAEYGRAVDAAVVPAPVLWAHPAWSQPDAPVIGVGWYEADRYARWLGLRLPTEAQWERAATWDAAAGHKRRFPWGDDWEAARCLNAEVLLGRSISGKDDWIESFWLPGIGLARGHVEAVGRRDDASPCGARMMVGHVWEWTRDIYRPSPVPGVRAVRGGSWVDDRNSCRGSYRTWSPPSMWRYGPTDIGFRCVLEASGARR